MHGPAASSALDRDQQILAPEFLDRAMPEWFQSGANVREQHDARRAVGVGVGLTKGDDGAHYVSARIVDPVAVQKVRHGVLRGFSVGIKNPKIELGKAEAPNGLVTDGTVCELSVCDRPANSECVFQLAKADGSGELALVEDPHVIEKTETFGLPADLYDRLPALVKDALTELAESGATVTAQPAEAAKADDAAAVEGVPVVVNVSVQAPETEKADLSAAGRKKAAAEGAAMADGSYPIKSKADLRKAIRAVGRGNADHTAIRKHIIKRAKALGLEAMVPDNWAADGSLKDANKADGVDEDLVAKAEQVLRDVRALAPSLTKADDGEGTDGGEARDIASADQAIAVIARLIISEAESLAQGNLNEACDISILLDAVRSLKWFKEAEQYEEQMMASTKSDSPDSGAAEPVEPAEGAPADPAVEAPTTETSAPDKEQTAAEGQQADDGTEDTETDATDGETGSEPDAVTKAVVAELVKAAVAEATTASEERTKALEAELAKANAAIEEFRAMPTPGGPALTRTAAQQAQAKNSDADRMRAEANQLLAKADQVSDRDLRDGYRERAKALLAKADA
ncbi:hypothetical protein [Streptomyces griseorubiginosus]|uniref:hypothetical protein n=1 Tax=Streptomyces griseorubiginosus TaxID=67304 RepID=UPI0033E00106